MDGFDMTVGVQIDSSCALSAVSMTRITALTDILLAHFVTSIACTLSLNSHLQKETERFGHLTVQFGF
jgi:hypothetical protein